MNSLQKLVALMVKNNDPKIADYVNKVTDVLVTAVQLADVSREDIELLVIAVQDFAAERARAHCKVRQGVETEVSDLLARVGRK